MSDLLAGTAAFTAALLLSWPLFTAKDLATGAGDWPAHAFRVREVLDHGLTSWSHAWAGGMPLWEGYQAVPHLVTAAFVAASGLGITQAMVVLTGLLLIVLRTGTYVAARMLGAPPAAALLGAVLLCLLDSVQQPAANYSELWGLALSPLALAAGYRWAGRPPGLLVAALGGAAVEVHPHLAVIAAIALAAGFCTSRAGRSATMLALQAGLFLTAGAVFWLPVLTSARPLYSEPYFVSTEFSRLLFSLATAGFVPGWPVLAAVAVMAALASLRRQPSRSPVRFVLLSALGVALLVSVSLLDAAPDTLRQAQLSRLVGVVPMLIALLLAALAAPYVRRTGWTTPACGLAVVLFGLTLFEIEPLPGAEAVVAGGEPVATMLREHTSRAEGRVLANPVLTAQASFADGGLLRFAGSYSGREWSILHGPSRFYMEGIGDGVKRAAYLAAHGVEYVILPSGVRPAIAHPESGSSAEWVYVASAGGLDLLRVPWPPAIAWHLPADARDGLTVPDASFRDTESAYVRDVIVGRLAALSAGGDAGRARVRYPDGETIVVEVADLDGRRYLVVSENWDRTWAATVNGRRHPVERFGANQIGIDLTGVTGDATVVLRHTWPATQVIGLLLTLASVPAALGLWIVITRKQKKGAPR